jgi:hypothetical protein
MRRTLFESTIDVRVGQQPSKWPNMMPFPLFRGEEKSSVEINDQFRRNGTESIVLKPAI